METNNVNNNEVIDLREIFEKLLSRKLLFVKVAIVVFVLSCAWILPEPRTYTTEVTLAPEMSSMTTGSALSDLASSFGFDIGGMESTDAIYPTIYPDIFESTSFAVSLFNVRVRSIDGDVDTTYYEYMKSMQKMSFWKVPFKWAVREIHKLTDGPDLSASSGVSGGNSVNEFFLTKKQKSIIVQMQDNITCSVDKKTTIITISVKDQDPLICACMADSIRVKLQQYIIDYRTRKAKVDVEYYAQLREEAKIDYENALLAYSEYSDTHFDNVMETVNSRKAALNNEMQSKLTVYNTVTTQLQAAKAKLQERTPSFTIIQCAVVPVKPTGPKRMIFVLGMLFLSMFGTVAYVFKKEIMDNMFRK